MAAISPICGAPPCRKCPLPWWDKRETHQVVRSDLAKLGVWLEEKQPVLDDYERAIGGELPKRIVAIWLIAVSVFRKRLGYKLD
jgi:hypothetical protein